jgi:hypothetical protein
MDIRALGWRETGGGDYQGAGGGRDGYVCYPTEAMVSQVCTYAKIQPLCPLSRCTLLYINKVKKWSWVRWQHGESNRYYFKQVAGKVFSEGGVWIITWPWGGAVGSGGCLSSLRREASWDGGLRKNFASSFPFRQPVCTYCLGNSELIIRKELGTGGSCL